MGCVCVWRGKACWQCGKEKPAGLLEHSGRMPASSYATGTLWPVPVSVCVFLIVCAQLNSTTENLRLVLACVHTVYVCSPNVCETACMRSCPAFSVCFQLSCAPAYCVCVCVCMCTCVGGEQMKTVLASYSMWSAASPLSLYLAYNPAPCFIMHSRLLLCGVNLTSQLASLFWT